MESGFSHMKITSRKKTRRKFPEIIEVSSVHKLSSPIEATRISPELFEVQSRKTRATYKPKHPQGTSSRQHRRMEDSSMETCSSSDSEMDIPVHGIPIRRTRGDYSDELDPPVTNIGIVPGLLKNQDSDDDVDLDPGVNEQKVSFSYSDAFSVSVVILQLLEKCSLYESEEGQAFQPVSSISEDLLSSLLQLLCRMNEYVLIEFKNKNFEGNYSVMDHDVDILWDSEHVASLQRHILRTLISVSSHICSLQNNIPVFCAIGFIQCMNDIINDSLAHLLPQVTLCNSTLFLFIVESLHGILLLLHTIFYSLPLNPAALKGAIQLFHEFEQSNGLCHITKVLMQLDSETDQGNTDTSTYVVKDKMSDIISSVALLINSMKKAKLYYIHSRKCQKYRHLRCDFSIYKHHHHDIFGMAIDMEAGNSMTDILIDCDTSEDIETADSKEQHHCSVAALAQCLLNVFEEGKSKVLKVRSLGALEESGLCCCVSPDVVCELLLKGIESYSSGMRGFVLSALTKILLEQLGGSKLIQRQVDICSVCDDSELQTSSSLSTSVSDNVKNTKTSQSKSDSALSSSDSSLPCNQKEVFRSRWHCVKFFNPLIFHENDSLSVHVMEHVMCLVSQGSLTLRKELFHDIYMPVYRAIKLQVVQMSKCDQIDPAASTFRENWNENEKGSVGSHHSLPERMIQYSLGALPLLLKNNSIKDMFINLGCIRLLCHLLKHSWLQKSVLKVFEALIILEENDNLDVSFLADSELSDYKQNKLIDQRVTNPDFPTLTRSDSGTTDVTDDAAFVELTGSTAASKISELFVNLLKRMHSGILSRRQNMKTADEDHNAEIIDKAPDVVMQIGSCEEYKDDYIKSLFDSVNIENMNIEKSCVSELGLLTNLWSSCEMLLTHSAMFQSHFVQSQCHLLVQDIIMDILELLHEPVECGCLEHLNCMKMCNKWFSSLLELLETMLAVYLQAGYLEHYLLEVNEQLFLFQT